MKTIKTILFSICFYFIVQPATSLVAAGDANEQGVTDDRDFKSSKVSYAAGDISADITFYDHPNLGQFYFYLSIDGNNPAEYIVYCGSLQISVREMTSTGGVGPEVYRGRATVSRGKYSLKFPSSALGLSAGSRALVDYWFFWMADGASDADRWPDAGTFQLKIY